MALSAWALTTVANLRWYIDQSRTGSAAGDLSEDVLEHFIDLTSAMMEAYCDRVLAIRDMEVTVPLARGCRDQYATIDGILLSGAMQVLIRTRNAVPLGAYPIRGIDTVQLVASDGAVTTIAERTDIGGPGWWQSADDDRLGTLHMAGYDINHSDRIVVAGSFGLFGVGDEIDDTDPDQWRARMELGGACLQWASQGWTARVPEENQITVDGMSRSIRDLPVPTRVAAVLNRYRRPL